MPPVAAILSTVTHIFPAVAHVLTTVSHIFPPVAHVFQTIVVTTPVAGITPVFPFVPYVFSPVPPVLMAVALVFPSVPTVFHAVNFFGPYLRGSGEKADAGKGGEHHVKYQVLRSHKIGFGSWTLPDGRGLKRKNKVRPVKPLWK
jgi:hypothetical protein